MTKLEAWLAEKKKMRTSTSFEEAIAVIEKLKAALERASKNIGDVCIYPEERKWEHEKREIKLAREALAIDPEKS